MWERSDERWNAFVEQSDDAWFWHTTDWMEYAEEYTRRRFIANRSFLITENDEWLAACPLLVEHAEAEEEEPPYNQFAFSGSPVPFPAMRRDLSPERRERVIRQYVEVLEEIAAGENVAHVRVRVPSVAVSSLSATLPVANPLLRYGFIDLPFVTQVTDLRRPAEELWSAIRKGARADIRQAEHSVEVMVWDQNTVTAERFAAYQDLHHKEAGRVTRSQRTFDLMLSWVKRGRAVLAEAQRGGRPLAFALLIRFGRGAYYGSGCRDPEDETRGAAHYLQWALMRWLKEHGTFWYDIGLQWFGPVWYERVRPKDLSIAAFKRGFGGKTVPVLTAEHFYVPSVRDRVIRLRWERYFAIQSELVVR